MKSVLTKKNEVDRVMIGMILAEIYFEKVNEPVLDRWI